MNTNYLVKARFFVLTHGEDCDGFFRPNVDCFTTKASAEYCLELSCVHSDGQGFELTDDIERAKEYCNAYGKTLDTTHVWDDIYEPKEIVY